MNGLRNAFFLASTVLTVIVVLGIAAKELIISTKAPPCPDVNGPILSLLKDATTNQVASLQRQLEDLTKLKSALETATSSDAKLRAVVEQLQSAQEDLRAARKALEEAKSKPCPPLQTGSWRLPSARTVEPVAIYRRPVIEPPIVLPRPTPQVQALVTDWPDPLPTHQPDDWALYSLLFQVARTDQPPEPVTRRLPPPAMVPTPSPGPLLVSGLALLALSLRG